MIVGRKEELDYLRNAINDDRSNFIAIYGRRRIGKTFLVNEAFNNKFTFKTAGLAPNKENPKSSNKVAQIKHFVDNLKKYGMKINEKVESWEKVFSLLDDFIQKSKDKRKIVFLDELAWMDTPQSGFLTAFESFWNDWMSGRKDVTLIVCASSSSWIVNKVIHNKGGLHNRVTKSINLSPFTLKECEEYSNSYNLGLSKKQILDSYMVFGGVPLYWSKFIRGNTPEMNIDHLFFEENAELKNEFDDLYDSLFNESRDYKKIVGALASKKKGLTRDEISNICKIGSNGDFSSKLENLENCGITRSYHCFGKKSHDTLYQLLDNFTLFYFNFMASKPNDERYFQNMSQTPKLNTWKGLSFERVVLQHVNEIKKALGFYAVSNDVCSWIKKGDKNRNNKGRQIDLIIARKDDVIDIIEDKYSISEYNLSKNEVDEWRERADDFVKDNSIKSAIHLILVTPYGINDKAKLNLITKVLTLEDLFI